MRATISYLQQGNRLLVSKLQVEALSKTPLAPTAPPAVVQPSPTGAGTGLNGDLTKQPGSKATIDNDITTQPGKKAPSDPDITKQPAR
jgi:hypothetical protein